ncbi:uncharacterized protein [Amphiura filiformis]|uniref:uncharacterized protein isoform X2 n=1 Tax=Amphiura filiformis TaxID=82378 RepID=UPI003B224C45
MVYGMMWCRSCQRQDCFHGPDIIARGSTQIAVRGSGTDIFVFSTDVISCNGLLITWTFFPTRAEPIKLLVLRPIGSEYKVVGVNDVPLESVTLGVANEYDVPELSRIAVEAGDVLGLVNCISPTSTCGHGIYLDHNTGSRQFSYKSLGSLTDATVNYTFVPIRTFYSTFSVSAVVSGKTVTTIVVIAVCAGGGVILIIAVVAIAIYCKRKQNHEHNDPYHSSHLPPMTRDPNATSAELQRNNTNNTPYEIPLGTLDNEGYVNTTGKDDPGIYQGIYTEVS